MTFNPYDFFLHQIAYNVRYSEKKTNLKQPADTKTSTRNKILLQIQIYFDRKIKITNYTYMQQFP